MLEWVPISMSVCLTLDSLGVMATVELRLSVELFWWWAEAWAEKVSV